MIETLQSYFISKSFRISWDMKEIDSAWCLNLLEDSLPKYQFHFLPIKSSSWIIAHHCVYVCVQWFTWAKRVSFCLHQKPLIKICDLTPLLSKVQIGLVTIALEFRGTEHRKCTWKSRDIAQKLIMTFGGQHLLISYSIFPWYFLKFLTEVYTRTYPTGCLLIWKIALHIKISKTQL